MCIRDSYENSKTNCRFNGPWSKHKSKKLCKIPDQGPGESIWLCGNSMSTYLEEIIEKERIEFEKYILEEQKINQILIIPDSMI